MELTSQQLSDIIAALRGELAESSRKGMDKRRFSRLGIQTKVELAGVSPDIMPRRFSGLTRDLSFGGMGITQAVPVYKGQEIAVRLPCGKGGILLLKCTVVHCGVLAHSLFAVGTQFVAEMGLEFLEQLAMASKDEVDRIRDSVLG